MWARRALHRPFRRFAARAVRRALPQELKGLLEWELPNERDEFGTEQHAARL